MCILEERLKFSSAVCGMASETIATNKALRAGMIGQHSYSKNVSQEHFCLSENVYEVIGVQRSSL